MMAKRDGMFNNCDYNLTALYWGYQIISLLFKSTVVVLFSNFYVMNKMEMSASGVNRCENCVNWNEVEQQ